jgi:D-alanyl-D-alanine-carboxypeptidase/D-alanyl-D-alanine-endopeptidase
MEPIYHNQFFLFVLLVALAGLTDLFKPQWKLRKRESKRLRKERRKKGKQTSNKEDSETTSPKSNTSTGTFPLPELRKVRIGGGIGLLIATIGVVCLQPKIGWTIQGDTPPPRNVSTLEQRLRQRVEKFIDENHVIGMTVAAVADGEETLFGVGRRDLQSQSPPDGETIYEIGSISKTFTGILLAHEIENGRAGLDDPVNDHLPRGITLPQFGDASIKLRHLTTHSSGFPRRADNFTDMGSFIDFVFGWDPYWDYTEDEFWEAVNEVELRSKPGERVKYSNFGTALLGTLMARHRHDSYESMVRSTICDPLGLSDTCVQLSENQRARLACGYRSVANIGPITLALGSQPWQVPDYLAGEGGMHSSCNDMLKYLKCNMGLMDHAVADSMSHSHKKLRDWFNDYSLGMNWILEGRNGHDIIWHNGRTSGFRCFIGFTNNRRFGVVILANSQADVDALGKNILDSMSEDSGDAQRSAGKAADSAASALPVASGESTELEN